MTWGSEKKLIKTNAVIKSDRAYSWNDNRSGHMAALVSFGIQILTGHLIFELAFLHFVYRQSNSVWNARKCDRTVDWGPRLCKRQVGYRLDVERLKKLMTTSI